jgi:hypothetical protein
MRIVYIRIINIIISLYNCGIYVLYTEERATSGAWRFLNDYYYYYHRCG